MKVFGPYALLQLIKSGGMGTVWRARDLRQPELRRDLALKTIVGRAASDPDFVKMFVDEAKVTVQLTQANIAQVYELGLVDGTYYFAMEYVSGQDVKSLFERSAERGYPTPVPLACSIVSKVCEALDYAYQKVDRRGTELKVVHRDVSPHNVLVSYEGEVKLIDFGIARIASTQEASDVIKGKLAWMSPEQIRGQPLDGRSDLFSAGVVLHELLTAERAFPGSDFAVLEKVRAAELVPPSRMNPRVPAELDAIVARATARRREDRYADAGEFASALQRFCFPAGRVELSRYMQSTFAEELAVERRRLASDEEALEEFTAAEHTVLVSSTQAVAQREGMVAVVPHDGDPGFLVDARPVTFGEFGEYLMACSTPVPPEWRGLTPLQLERPVVGVGPAAAQAYADWRGKRLLTLWEWRRASQQLVAPEHQFGQRWEWTSSPSPRGGHFVCGGAHRGRPDSWPSREHVSFESSAAPDIGFRCALDEDV